MTHLKIELNVSSREIVSDKIIKKLYELVSSGTLDNTSHLQGWLYVPLTYRLYVETITDDSSDITKDLTVEYGDYAIPFADPAVKTAVIAALNLSSDGVTETQAADAQFTSSSFADNTYITTFNEFDLFTRANDNPPAYLFKGCTNLSEINLSNATYFSDREFTASGIEDLYAPRLNTINGTRLFKGSGVKTIRSLGNITNIPALMFSHCGNLQSIVLPETLVEIGGEAFSWYGVDNDALYTTKLYDTVTITGLNNVTTVGSRAFDGCSNFQIPIAELSNLLSIGAHGFLTCAKLTGELNCPNITTLSENSFTSSGINKIKCLGKINSIPAGLINKDQNSSSALKTALTEVYLPYECTTIGVSAFEWNTALTTIKQYTDSVDNWTVDLQTGEKIPSSYGDISRVTNIGNAAFSRTGLTSIYLENVTTLGTRVFENAASLAIQNLSMPNLTSIGSACFKNTSIQQVSNLGSITFVPQECFNGCTSLTSVTLPSTVTSIGSNAFRGDTNLTTASLGGATSFSNYTFFGCTSLSNITIPNAIEFSVVGSSDTFNYGNYAFYLCNITFPLYLTVSMNSLRLASSTNKNLLNHTFYGNTMHNVTLDSTVKGIGAYCFGNTGLESISADYVEYIGEGCFSGTNVTLILLPSLIGYYSEFDIHPIIFFANCPNLTKVVFGHLDTFYGVTGNGHLSDAWFYNDSNINYVDFGDSLSTVMLSNANLDSYGCCGAFTNTAGSMRTVIIRNTSVPTISILDDVVSNITRDRILGCFGGPNITIYVPNDSLTNYRTAQYWSLISDKIESLNVIEPTS